MNKGGIGRYLISCSIESVTLFIVLIFVQYEVTSQAISNAIFRHKISRVSPQKNSIESPELFESDKVDPYSTESKLVVKGLNKIYTRQKWCKKEEFEAIKSLSFEIKDKECHGSNSYHNYK